MSFWNRKRVEQVPDGVGLVGIVFVGVGLSMLLPPGYVWAYSGVALIVIARMMARSLAG